MISVNCIEELNRANCAAVGRRGSAALNWFLPSKIESPFRVRHAYAAYRADKKRPPEKAGRMGVTTTNACVPHAPLVLLRLLIGTTFCASATSGCTCCRCSRRTLAKVFRRSVSMLFVYRNERSSIDFTATLKVAVRYEPCCRSRSQDAFPLVANPAGSAPWILSGIS